MKVQDILETRYDRKMGRISVNRGDIWRTHAYKGSKSNVRDELGSLGDVVSFIDDTPEWKELNSIAKFVSTPRELENGTLAFATDDHNGARISIFASGQIRRMDHGIYTMPNNPQPERYFQVPSPEPDPDLKTRYVNAMRKTIAYMKKRVIGKPAMQDNVIIVRQGLTTLEGLNLPVSIKGSLNVAHNKLTDFSGFPRRINRFLNLSGNPYRSLHGIADAIDYIGHRIYIPKGVRSSILGLLKIDGLNEIQAPGAENTDLARALFIVHRFMHGDRDVLDCQLELVQAGLKEFAKL